MLNVPSPSFPAPGSQQRVALAGRSKVPLKSGRSLMDWIRLTKSGKDLTGLKGRLLEVTEEELVKHNKKDDCWICIRGLIYNVTPYMEYHPGGEDELMKAAGTDGTDLFDQVHRWVNYESMLKECLIGRIALKPVASLKEICPPVTEENRTLNGIFPKNKVLDDCSKEIVPSYDWFQTQDSVTVVIYTKQKDINSELVIADVQECKLRGEIIVKDYSYLVHVELSYAVFEDMIVQVSEKVGKVEFVLKKKENLSWKKLGQSLESHNSFVKCTDRGLYYRKCKLLSKTNVSHDTRLFCVGLPPGTHIQVPVGHHLYLKQTISGTEIVKPYTPVSSCLVSPFKTSPSNDKAQIYFMVKIYPGGLFTPVLDTLQIGDCISLSNPEGNFRKSQIEDVEDLILLAAGTGFTPMVKLLSYALTNSASLRAERERDWPKVIQLASCLMQDYNSWQNTAYIPVVHHREHCMFTPATVCRHRPHEMKKQLRRINLSSLHSRKRTKWDGKDCPKQHGQVVAPCFSVSL